MNSPAYTNPKKKLAKRLKKLAYEDRKIIVKHHLALKMVRAHAASRGEPPMSNELFVCMVLEAEYGAKEEKAAHG